MLIFRFELPEKFKRKMIDETSDFIINNSSQSFSINLHLIIFLFFFSHTCSNLITYICSIALFSFTFNRSVSALIFTLNIKEIFIYHLIDLFSFSRSIDLNCFIADGENIYIYTMKQVVLIHTNNNNHNNNKLFSFIQNNKKKKENFIFHINKKLLF
jgi:hypothetical protein